MATVCGASPRLATQITVSRPCSQASASTLAGRLRQCDRLHACFRAAREIAEVPCGPEQPALARVLAHHRLAAVLGVRYRRRRMRVVQQADGRRADVIVLPASDIA